METRYFFTKFILSPVQDLVGWRFGLQGQIISEGDKIFFSKFILSPVQDLVGFRSGLQCQIISVFTKCSFFHFFQSYKFMGVSLCEQDIKLLLESSLDHCDRKL